MRRQAIAAAFVLFLPAGTLAGDAARTVEFADLAGWPADDHAQALSTFLETCAPDPEPGSTASSGPCRAGHTVAAGDEIGARRFFETWFEPLEISPSGFLTGYYEPEFSGCLEPAGGCRTPLLARPADLVTLPPSGERPAGWPPGLTAARRTAEGFEPYPDRAAIEDGALAARARPIVYLDDAVDAFMVHVQGSARIRLPDGDVIRVGFDGRNGHPYTSVARVLAARLGEPPAGMTADRAVAWLKAEPEAARELMRANRSFIFFRRLHGTASGSGPIGAAGVPLTPGRSLAVDRAAWPYGTPVWLEGELPRVDGRGELLRRLTVAQDTGAAIVGPARGDLFLGSGAEAGLRASRLRNPVRWVVLRPRASVAVPGEAER